MKLQGSGGNEEEPRKTSTTRAFEAQSAERRVMAAGASAVVVGAMASVCCVGPVILGALGIGAGATGLSGFTAHFAKALVPYRPFLMMLTILVIGLSFYLAYRPGGFCAAKGGEACTAASPQSVRRMRTLVWIMALSSLALILYPYLP